MANLCVVIPARRHPVALLQDLQRQTRLPDQVEVVLNVSPSGRARNLGAARTRAEVLVFLDDDVRLPCPDTLARLEQHCGCGLVGTAQQLPADSSRFQRAVAAQIPRSVSEVPSELLTSDLATTACCAIPRELFVALGGFHEGLERGVDPELRNRVRLAGRRVAVIPEVWHTHPTPASLGAFLRLAFRDGRASARAARHHPRAVLFNPPTHAESFRAHRPLPLRVLRRLTSMAADLVRGRWLGLAYSLAYGLGYALA